MGLKKIAAGLVFFTVLFAGCLSAANSWNPDSFVIEQAQVTMPEIIAYVHSGTESGVEWRPEEISAFLGEDSLLVKSVNSFGTEDEGIFYILLVDVSTSISNAQMRAIKDSAVSLLGTLKGKDQLALISFGVKVEVLLTGAETSEVATNKINSLKNNQGGTQLYSGLNRAIELAKTLPEEGPQRVVAVVISDGVDYAVGEYTADEVGERLKGESLPLYALGFSGNKDHINTLGILARQSNGQLQVVNQSTLKGALMELVDFLNDFYSISLKADTNIPSQKEETLKLSITSDKNYIGEISVTPVKRIPDNTPPTFIVEQLSTTTLRFTFSEPVLGADVADNYFIRDKDAKRLPIISVGYDPQKNQALVQLPKKPISGAYQFLFLGVTDNSFERNPLIQELFLELEGQSAIIEFLHSAIVDYGWVLLLVALLAVGFIIYRILAKRRSIVSVEGKIGFGDMVEAKYHLTTPQADLVTLVVTDVTGACKTVTFTVNESFFVGRGEMNNLSFNDVKMSRQHFVIEVKDKEGFITDLGTTNGTFVNGIRLKAKRRLEKGDIINAGQQRIIFYGLGNG